MNVPLKMWFDPSSTPDRRKQHNRLRRIAVESEQQEEAQIDRWLGLADAALKPLDEDEVHRRPRRTLRAA